jgi:hypothetical protein
MRYEWIIIIIIIIIIIGNTSMCSIKQFYEHDNNISK